MTFGKVTTNVITSLSLWSEITHNNRLLANIWVNHWKYNKEFLIFTICISQYKYVINQNVKLWSAIIEKLLYYYTITLVKFTQSHTNRRIYKMNIWKFYHKFILTDLGQIIKNILPSLEYDSTNNNCVIIRWWLLFPKKYVTI